MPDIPTHLIELQREIDAATRKAEEIAAAMRPATEAIATGGYSDEEFEPLRAAREKRDALRFRMIEERAPHEEALGGQLKAGEAIVKAARAE